VLALAARGAFRPEHVVTRSYGLEQVDEAYKTLAAGQIQGRAIIKM
jgi:D-arabinose 1-dehydrogenase-like Zn-dependent alcohol dehydrogenase